MSKEKRQFQKEEKKRQRDEIKKQKLQDKKRQRDQKLEMTRSQQQEDGKFASLEIAYLLSSSSSSTTTTTTNMNPFVQNMLEYLKEEGYPHYKHISINNHNNVNLGNGITCMEFIRRDYHGLGGAETAIQLLDNKEDVEYMNVIVFIVHDPMIFLWPLLISDSQNNNNNNNNNNEDYPSFQQWISSLRQHYNQQRTHSKTCLSHARNHYQNTTTTTTTTTTSSSSSTNVRFLMIVNQESIISTSKLKRSKCQDLFQNIILYALMECQLECEFLSNETYMLDWIKNICRSLHDAPYYEPATELHCIPNYAQGRSTTDDNGDDIVPLLRCFPRMGDFRKPRQLCQTYPNLVMLWQDYHSTEYTQEEKELLVAHAICQSNPTSNNHIQPRFERKLSEQMFHFFTSSNPEEIID